MAEKSAAQKSEPNGISKASQEKKKFAPGKSPLNFIPGKVPILLIAPHGRLKKPRDDINTNQIADGVAKQIDCSAIINYSVSRKELDYNKKAQAVEDADFTSKLHSFVEKNKPALVVWIHGASDNSVKKPIYQKDTGFKGKPDDLHALIGFGQGPNPVNRKGEPFSNFTAKNETVARLRELLTKHGMTTFFTREGAPKFCGRNPNNMNQYFVSQDYSLDDVESIQLEIRKKGFRKNEEDVKKTVKIISDSLSELLGLTDDTLVDKAYRYLADIFKRHFYGALLEAGEYIVKEFYDNNYDLARDKKMVKDKSLHRLIQRLQEGKGDAPSQAWVYNSVKIAVDNHRLAKVSIYRNLPQSHKVLLAYIKDDETKKELAGEINEKKLTVAELRERIKEIRSGDRLKLDYHLPLERLNTLKTKDLLKLQHKAKTNLSWYKQEIENLESSLKRISGVIAEKAKVKVGKRPVKKG